MICLSAVHYSQLWRVHTALRGWQSADLPDRAEAGRAVLCPGAGTLGDRIVAAGTPHQVAASATSRTARYLKAALH